MSDQAEEQKAVDSPKKRSRLFQLHGITLIVCSFLICCFLILNMSRRNLEAGSACYGMPNVVIDFSSTRPHTRLLAIVKNILFLMAVIIPVGGTIEIIIRRRPKIHLSTLLMMVIALAIIVRLNLKPNTSVQELAGQQTRIIQVTGAGWPISTYRHRIAIPDDSFDDIVGKLSSVNGPNIMDYPGIYRVYLFDGLFNLFLLLILAYFCERAYQCCF